MNESQVLVRVPENFYSLPKTERSAMQMLLIAEKLLQAENVEGALKYTMEAMSYEHDSPAALWLRAQIAIKQNDHGLTVTLLKAIAAQRQSPEIFNNLGSSLVSMQKIEAGEEYFRKALKLDPKCRAALNNMALCKVHQGQFEAAEHYSKRALEVAKEKYAKGEWDRSQVHEWDTLETYGYSLLARKIFKEGWENYNAMVGYSKSRPWKPIGDEPRLTVEAFEENRGKNKKLYIRGEQGIGDEIHFASIFEQASKDFNILYDADPILQPLMQRSFPYLEVFPYRKAPPEGRNYGRAYKPDFHCLQGDLARFYRQSEDDFPGTKFLTADPELTAMWKARLAFYPGLKVGFTFQGGIRRTYKERRTVGLSDMLPMFNLPNCTFVCLGWENDTQEELDKYVNNRDTGRVVFFAETMQEHGQKNYDHVAALIDSLDVIVSVPQSVVHLAGALGKKVMVLAPEISRWFYYQTRGNTDKLLWYPDVTKYHQRKGKWPIAEVSTILREMSHV